MKRTFFFSQYNQSATFLRNREVVFLRHLQGRPGRDKLQLHAISAGQPAEEFIRIASSISRYVDFIHIREHHRTAAEIFEMGKSLLEKGVPSEQIIINNRVDAAAALGVKGVQLGYHSLPVRAVRKTFFGLIIGKSVHSLEEAVQAEEDGADYVMYGHCFPTGSKPGIEPKGLSSLEKIAGELSVPVIALGGISPDKMDQVISAGASGAAVLSGIFKASNPEAAASAFAAELKRRGGRYEESI
jgi:thiazole tautomerase (transcriptional regulator TenI)